MVNKSSAVVLVVAAVALIAAIAPGVRGADAGSREVRLVARGMAFEIQGERGSNPTITVRAGELVRLVLRNEAPGFVHDFAIDDLGVAIDPIVANEEGSVTFRAPATRGSHAYVCRPHAQMMRGVLRVTD